MKSSLMSFELSFFTMVASQGMGLLASTQLLLDPETTWVSWPVMVAILGLAIYSTIKVVRFVDAVRRDLDELKKRTVDREGADERD